MKSSYQLKRDRLTNNIKAIANDNDFWAIAKELFDFQISYNLILSDYLTSINVQSRKLHFYFLPISLFKTHNVKTGNWQEELIYLSSGTTTSIRSRHFIRSKLFYLDNAKSIFQKAYGNIRDICFLCLLPSYLNNKASSLIDMCTYFIESSRYSQSGFYLDDYDKLNRTVNYNETNNIPTLLIGVSFALLDFVQRFQYESLIHVKIMKTGGMKGTSKDINGSELDDILKSAFGVSHILAEYGMTECQSQLYSHNGQSYEQNDKMKMIISDVSDPFSYLERNKTGRINIIDLANLDTCAFIATDDLGFIDKNNKIHILGRLDYSDLRGCNMLFSQ